jgi:LysR family cys regulon transcriptional activator
MTLQQLRYLCAIVDQGMNITRAARFLQTSQPGISRYLQLLEAEFGVKLLLRDGNRILGLTQIGQTVYAAAKRIQNEVAGVSAAVSEYRNGDVGDLTLAVAHGLARYKLPPLIRHFMDAFPKVKLNLRQGAHAQIWDWLAKGEADMAIATVPSGNISDLILLQCDEIYRVALTPTGHPLTQKRTISLRDLASYPIITYEQGVTARIPILRAFQKKRVEPNIVLTATDEDTMKLYVRAGLGIALVGHLSYNEEQDAGLAMVDARNLFEPSPIYLGIRRNTYLPNYMISFVNLVAPHLSETLRNQDLQSLDRFTP